MEHFDRIFKFVSEAPFLESFLKVIEKMLHKWLVLTVLGSF